MIHVKETPLPAVDSLKESYARWQKSVEAELNGVPFEKKLVTRTFEGVALQPLYTRADLAGIAHVDVPPGVAPFGRGARADGHCSRRWQVAQEIAAANAAEFNAALLTDLGRGLDAVVLTPDPTARAGFDAGETANVHGEPGLPVSDLHDLSTALAGVDLNAVPVHIAAGADPLPLAALYLSVARERGVAWEKLAGSLTGDPLGEWAESGRLAAGVSTLYESLAGWAKWGATHAPNLQTIGVNAAIWADAGGTAVQELAFGIACGAEYLRELGRRGVRPERAAIRMRFRFSSGPQFFMELAKFRAFRLLWTRVVGAFGVPHTLAAEATVHASTARWNQTRLDPHVNMLRATTEALSAVLGGCDSIAIAPFDAVANTSDSFSRRIARNVHTLLAEEFSLAQVADAGGGSWYIEKLTDELARSAWAAFRAVEGRGGFAAALKEGHLQRLVAVAAAEKKEAVEKRRLGLIGTNLFPNLKEKPLPSAERAHATILPHRRTAVLLPPKGATWPVRFEAALAAAQSGASVGQLARLTRRCSVSESAVVPALPWRAAAGFEELRAAADAMLAQSGARPKVFLAKFGPPLLHKARADFSAGFFAIGGFEVLGKQSFDSADAAAEAAAKSGAPIAVLCSSDDTYPALVPVFARAAKAANPKLTVVLAGLPAEAATVASFRKAGVDEFIHLRANVHEVLAKLMKRIGVLA